MASQSDSSNSQGFETGGNGLNDRLRATTETRRDFLSRAGICALWIGLPEGLNNQSNASEPFPKEPSTSSPEWLYYSATTIARLIKDKELSAVEVTRACINRIREVNPHINAVCGLAHELAIKDAERADDFLRRTGQVTGPFHGVPFTVKDCIDTAGIHSTAGTLGRKDFVPDKDATTVQRLKKAGAILLGKTNTPEITMGYLTENLLFGRTNNPYNLRCTSGGSSGGSAAVVAVGGSFLDIGSDTAGSLRVPAHFCGVAALKPTHGRIPKTGNIIPSGSLVGDMTVLGPIARSVEDLSRCLPILSGPDGVDPDTSDSMHDSREAVDPKSLRVACFKNNGRSTLQPEIADTIDRAAGSLDRAGFRIQDALPTGFHSAADLANEFNYLDGGAFYRQILKSAGTVEYHPMTQAILEILKANALSSAEASSALSKWAKVKSEMIQFMEDFELILCPVCSNVAQRHGSRVRVDFSDSYVFNLLGWPAVVVRAGRTKSGLPIGIQIVAKHWMEHLALTAARVIEDALGGWQNDLDESLAIRSL